MIAVLSSMPIDSSLLARKRIAIIAVNGNLFFKLFYARSGRVTVRHWGCLYYRCWVEVVDVSLKIRNDDGLQASGQRERSERRLERHFRS